MMVGCNFLVQIPITSSYESTVDWT